MVIDLDKLDSPVIDLKGVTGLVKLKGAWQGERLRIVNAYSVRIEPQGFTYIYNTKGQEDALILDAPENFSLFASGGDQLLLNGSITVWGLAKAVFINGVHVDRAHTGIRINQDLPYNGISITNCRLTNIEHEGIYIGPSRPNPHVLQNVKIKDNIISNCGWDGIQVGNCHNFELSGNILQDCGNRKTYGQDFDITINPGSLGHIKGNFHTGSIQVLDSRVFFK